jgi:hypothetical protein
VDGWLSEVEEFDVDVYGEVLALISALQTYGTNLGDPESHPVVTSTLDMHALKLRTALRKNNQP